ncbi:MAG: MaoC family dehydratase [Hyphomicrobiales bacterium]|nr:MaoC family dehydratase [Hyphomicrobiales bacterium]
MPKIFFEDFHVGTSGECGPRAVTRDEIVAFAREFDPQPFHLDEEAAKSTFVGELIASGWHTCALMMRIMFDGMIHNSSSMGAPGMEEVKWQKPVRPGDTVTARWNVLETRSSRSRPEMGLVKLRIDLLNQRGETACQQLFWMMAGRREKGFAKEPGASDQGNGAAISSPEPAVSASPRGLANLEAKAQITMPKLAGALAYFDDLVVGETNSIGSCHFTAENIIRFAKAFDPQPFHVDPEAAAKSHFGGLCASGWHTGAACMRKLIDRRAALRDAMLAKGVTPPAMGSSPGFTDLVWHKPVYAGDTIDFASTLVSKRPSASRPRWGLIFSRNTGTNQKGELVYSFVGSVFIERRPS